MTVGRGRAGPFTQRHVTAMTHGLSRPLQARRHPWAESDSDLLHKMRRIFGGQKKPEAPKPTLAEAADSAGKRDQVLGAKIKELDKQLAEFKVQLKTARPGPAQNRIKQRAMQVLKQKRMYESQQDQVRRTSLASFEIWLTCTQIRGMVSNMEQVKFASENGIFRCETVLSFLGLSLTLKFSSRSHLSCSSFQGFCPRAEEPHETN